MRRSDFGYNNSKGFDSRVFPDTDVDFAGRSFHCSTVDMLEILLLLKMSDTGEVFAATSFSASGYNPTFVVLAKYPIKRITLSLKFDKSNI